MNKPNPEVESSCKRQENGDVSADSDRPLKKARFAWQVKGKYHLKNDHSDIEKPSPSHVDDSEAVNASSDSENETNFVGNTEQNLEILGDYLLKQDFNNINTAMTENNKSLQKTCSKVSTPDMYYPAHSSSKDNVRAPNTFMSCNSDEHVNYFVIHQSYPTSEEHCIHRWQQRQIARGIVDNTINRVLDSWLGAPLPQELDHSRFLALDVADLLNNMPGYDSMENAGILMAISVHGLQSNTNSSSSSKEEEPGVSNVSANTSRCEVEPVPASSSSAVKCGNDNTHVSLSNTYEDLCENSLSQNKSRTDSSDSCFSENSFSALFPKTLENSDENDSTKTSYEICDVSNNPEDDFFMNNFDFMDTAVSFAIKNKGLTSHGTDYG